MTTASLELLPEEIILMILEQIEVPESYKGYFMPSNYSRPPPADDFFSNTTQNKGCYLRDVMNFSATCKRLRQIVGTHVWPNFKLHTRTISDPEDYYAFPQKYQLSVSMRHLDISPYLARSYVLEYVTVFEPFRTYVCLPLDDTQDVSRQIHNVIRLVNPETMPRLRRLILNVLCAILTVCLHLVSN